MKLDGLDSLLPSYTIELERYIDKRESCRDLVT